MSSHEQFAEDLALHSLGALEGEERTRLEAHLGECAVCRTELEQLRGDGALLAMSAMGPRPPQRARQRLLDAVAREASGTLTLSQKARNDGATTVAAEPRRSWWGTLGWAAAAAVVIFAIALQRENFGLKEKLATANLQAADNAQKLEEFQRVAAPLIEPEAQHVTLVAAKAPPQPQGKAFYLRQRGSLVFVASNMPALPPHKAYELWLVPVQGKPIAAGVFKPDSRGNGTVVNPPLTPGTEAKAFAITVEDEAGVAAATSPIVMIGAGE